MEAPTPTMRAEPSASSLEEVPPLDRLDQVDEPSVRVDEDGGRLSPSSKTTVRHEHSSHDQTRFQDLLKQMLFHVRMIENTNTGFFRSCPDMQAAANRGARRLAENWAFSLLGAAAILCHCVVLVMIADSTEAVQNMPAQTISAVCMVFFAIDLIIRLVAAAEPYFWRNGWVLFDIFLVTSSVIELILSSFTDVVGKGHFLFASLRLMRLLLMFNENNVIVGRRIQHAASVVMMCFGSTIIVSFGVLACVCLAWALFAVAWSHIFQGDDVMPYFSTFKEAFYTEVLVTTGGLDWSRRIIEPLQRSNDSILIAKSILVLLFFFFMIVFIENIVICNFVEYASKAARKCQHDRDIKRITATVQGIEKIREILDRLAEEEFGEEGVVLDLLPNRQSLKDALKDSEAALVGHMIDIKEVLVLYDSYDQGGEGVQISRSDFLFSLVRAFHPTDSKDMLVVEHLQAQCTLAVERTSTDMEHNVSRCTEQLDEMKAKALRLKSEIDQLSHHVHAAQQDISEQVRVVEEQYQKCQRDETERAVVRRLQEKEHLHLERQELHQKIAALRKEAAWIRQQRLQSAVFGIFEDWQPLSRQSVEGVAEDAQLASSSSGGVVEAHEDIGKQPSGQKAMDTEKFRRASDMLRKAVKKRLEDPILKQRLQLQFESVL